MLDYKPKRRPIAKKEDEEEEDEKSESEEESLDFNPPKVIRKTTNNDTIKILGEAYEYRYRDRIRVRKSAIQVGEEI